MRTYIHTLIEGRNLHTASISSKWLYSKLFSVAFKFTFIHTHACMFIRMYIPARKKHHKPHECQKHISHMVQVAGPYKMDTQQHRLCQCEYVEACVFTTVSHKTCPLMLKRMNMLTKLYYNSLHYYIGHVCVYIYKHATSWPVHVWV